jgi:hypothetical protein
VLAVSGVRHKPLGLATCAASTLFPDLQDLFDRHSDRGCLFGPLLVQRRGTLLPHLSHSMLNLTAQRFELVEASGLEPENGPIWCLGGGSVRLNASHQLNPTYFKLLIPIETPSS